MEAENSAELVEVGQLAERLKAAVRAAGGAPRVAELSGVPLRTVTSYMGGEADPKVTKLERIARACRTSIDALLGRKLSSGDAENGDDLLTNVFNLKPGDVSRADDPPAGFVIVRQVNVEASAGAGRAVIPTDEDDETQVAFREVWLRALGVTPRYAELIWARGDSMEPTIRSGDLLLVNRAIDKVVTDGIYVIVKGGDVSVKRLQVLFDRSLRIVSDNDRYAVEAIPAQQVDSLTVIGQVVWYGRAI